MFSVLTAVYDAESGGINELGMEEMTSIQNERDFRIIFERRWFDTLGTKTVVSGKYDSLLVASQSADPLQKAARNAQKRTECLCAQVVRIAGKLRKGSRHHVSEERFPEFQESEPQLSSTCS